MLLTDLSKLSFAARKGAIALSETAGASESVIRQRLGIINAALSNPFNADLAELLRMVPEKILAFSEAGASLMYDWFALQTEVWAQAQDLTMMLITPAHHAQRADRAQRRATRIAGGLTGAAGRALEPIQAAVTANDSRLKNRARNAA
ncbi:MAG: hypothetical protein JOY99_08845 [Sphingomonadaceae bacterium]|nr:hypothetical protein [Sphingomonadaceae bacterium]